MGVYSLAPAITCLALNTYPLLCLEPSKKLGVGGGRSKAYMANIHQDGHSIRNIQVVSSNRVQSTHFCEANDCRIFKPFFLFIR